tara:strand:- start:199 stop:342 length:144 start_codon:yes stop_codon:yes gene_type:complete
MICQGPALDEVNTTYTITGFTEHHVEPGAQQKYLEEYRVDVMDISLA